MYKDEQLVKGCLAGDSRVQKGFYDHFAPRMLGVCYRYTRNIHEAEDVLQEGFIKAFRCMKDFRGEGTLEGWLRRIIVTTALNYLKSQKNFRHEYEITTAMEISDHASNELSSMENKEVIELIQQLPAGYRAVLNLFGVEGYSHKEIGAMLSITESTSRSQYARARQLLLKKIEQKNKIGIHHG